jgi:flap endonuclease-1
VTGVQTCALPIYDSLLFGAPRLLRYLTIYGREFLPSKGASRALKPELIDFNEFLSSYNITREQLVDLAILIGTDFNEGVKGIGPKTALKLVKEYKKLENLPSNIQSKIPSNCDEIREIFLNPEATSNYNLKYGELDEDALYQFLCDQRDFARKNVETVVRRMRNFYQNKKRTSLEKWLYHDKT